MSDDDRTLTPTSIALGGGGYPWASGSLLPTAGKSSWNLKIERSVGITLVGVCNAAATHSWGLYLYSGRLLRYTRNVNGMRVDNSPPPRGFPDGNNSQVLRDSHGQPASLQGRQASGTVIQVLFDHDKGTLSFRIDTSQPIFAVGGFPKGATLRPFATLYSDQDRLSLVRPRLWEMEAEMSSSS